MKRDVKTMMLLAAGGLLCLRVAAVTADPADNRYKVISERNVFGLKPPPPPVDPASQKPPPPKITLQGITRFLDKKQALFKVALPARPPEPAKESSLVLAEGERSGEITVLEIDETAGAIKFDNYGTVQTLTLEKDAAKPTPGALPPPMMAPSMPMPMGGAAIPAPAPAGGGVSTTTIGGGQMKTIPTRPLRATPEGGTPVGGAAVTPQSNTTTISSTTAGLDRDAAALVTAAEYQNAKNKGDPTAALYPPDHVDPNRNKVTTPPPPPK
ncbi:MAG: hypothetical protein EPO07_07425 [Verrucomicrobia bacterium]|nr:MAG: hypothetical protein EPO07_07425 [Verrucomicrobiota bacterium]